MRATWFKRLALTALAVGLLAAGAVGVMVLAGWWRYHSLQRSIVEKMDQYYLNLTVPGREEYLLEGDENFVVPYMASKLSISAVPTRIFDVHEKLIGEFSTEMIPEFFRAFADNAEITVHIHREAGKNGHHIVEAAFKAFGRALSQAVALNDRVKGVPSTKGSLGVKEE